MANPYTEDMLVEQPAIALFEALEWDTVNCFHETFGGSGNLGRETSSEVVLKARLRPVLQRLNPSLPAEALTLAIEDIARDHSLMTSVQANREIYQLLKNGVKVTFENAKGEQITETVTVIDWQNPENNDFLLASQLWVSGEMYKRRCDLVGFINGLPLVFIELKTSHKKLENAYRNNLKDYKETIPQFFWYNALIILSNGSQSRIGSLTAAWEHFADWKKINNEGEEGLVSLETMLRGTCEKRRLLDLVENFILFADTQGGTQKLLAKNHQCHGVNSAVAAVANIRENQGRLGVFWHTQGSGKSYSMVFFAQKVLRTLLGNWTFLIVTDRQELDGQIYKNFAGCGVVTEEEKRIHATSGGHLQELLQEDHRYVFTLIQKFRTEKGEAYPLLSERTDIIVITDEAHRSQYDIFALNMRNALPNAAFIGFTGTPLMVGEELTRKVFGDYVSIYNFRQSVDDGATVPLFYENRIPELQLTNDNLNEEMAALLEEAELDEAQELRLEREFSREYHLITRDQRLDKIAADLVSHFLGRGHRGKGMFIAIDKLTAVRMYEKVRANWQREIEHIRDDLAVATGTTREGLEEKLAYLELADMAVVVSQSQNELELFREKGIDFKPHRLRMVKEDLEKKFKDPDDPFCLVFVCAMWITGFDVPSCNTIYLDKPMKNHTLMQTIARANRVFRDKVNGLIVDYVGVFRNLQRALAIYGSGFGGGTREGECPVQAKVFLVTRLREKIGETEEFCARLGVPLNGIQAVVGFELVRLLDDAVEAILVSEESKRTYLALAGMVERLFKAILPDPIAVEFAPKRKLIAVIAEKIRSLDPEVDISGIMAEVEALLDESVAAEAYVIRDAHKPIWERQHDLSKIDFEALRKKFESGRKRTEIERLKAALERKVREMVTLNRTRMDFLERFQRLIDEYNNGAHNVEAMFEELLRFANSLNEEERRHMAESLSEEELAIFDVLTKPELELSDKERDEVKKGARWLLSRLKDEKLVLDWRRKEQTRAAVRQLIDIALDEFLPRVYNKALFEQKCERVYQHVYDSYAGQGRSIYGKEMVV
ncbi:MAG: type I restriction endonuclease subunit R [Geobacter sp.]|nr:MAG: type I restriction endonuclease subunit R [Geobacter sp.]